jgi:hypothetical protein
LYLRLLELAGAGIVCLTSENRDARWILFEAGALSRTGKKVWTVLLDLDPADIAPPLSWFQHTKAEKEDILLMVESINKTVDSPNADLHELFGLLWPSLAEEIERIRQLPVATAVTPHRDAPEILAELLDIARDTERITTPRMEKMLRMLDRIYEAVLHEGPPSLAVLKTLAFSKTAAADPLRSFIADTPHPLKVEEPKN